MNLKTIVVLVFFAIELCAQNILIPHMGSVDYANSSKDKGWFTGIYYQTYMEEDYWEFSYERTEISYIDQSLGDLKQNDFTAVWTRYTDKNTLIRAGGHYIDSNEAPGDQVFIVFAGIKYFEGYDFDMGADAYYSSYSKYTYDTNSTLTGRGESSFSGAHSKRNKGLDMLQLTGSIGLGFGDYLSVWGSFYTKFHYDYIRPVTENGELLQDDYHSAGCILKNFNGSWTTEIGVWFGKQVFAVRNNGFMVYNLAEEHTGGMHASMHYKFEKQLGLRVEIVNENFREAGFNDASSQSVLGVLNYDF